MRSHQTVLDNLLNSPNSVGLTVAANLMDLISSYEVHKNTPQYQQAVQRSLQQQEGHKRLSCELWWAQYHYTRGRFLVTKLRNKEVDFHDLDSKEKELVEDFESRRSANALDRLFQQKRPPYRGAGTEVGTQQC